MLHPQIEYPIPLTNATDPASLAPYGKRNTFVG